MSNTVHLTERVGFSPSVKVDREKCLLRDVKLLGWDSGNRRKYVREGCDPAKYIGARGNIDHGQKTVASRFYKVIEAYPKEDGLYGVAHYNPKHPLAEAILWFAENQPDAIGMSHDADGRVTQNPDGSMTVHEILKVNSVDIVSDPATTKGLFESMDPMTPGTAPVPNDTDADFKAQLGELAKACFTAETFDHKAVKERLKHLINLLKTTGEKDEEVKPDEKPDAVKESIDAKLKMLEKELDVYRVKEALEGKKILAKKLCEAAQLPKEAVTDFFVADLATKADEASMREAIQDRRTVLKLRESTKPVAPPSGGGKLSVDDFVSNLRSNKEY